MQFTVPMPSIISKMDSIMLRLINNYYLNRITCYTRTTIIMEIISNFYSNKERTQLRPKTSIEKEIKEVVINKKLKTGVHIVISYSLLISGVF